MGGRSSSFKFNEQTGEIFSQVTKVYPLIENNADTISEINNTYIDELQEDNHIVCRSTNSFNYEIMNSNFKKIYEIIKKYPIIANNLNDAELNIRGATFSDKSTQACFSYNVKNKENMTIFLGQDVYTKNKQVVEMNAKFNQNKGFWSKSDDKELVNSVIAHEYGHFIEKLIIDKKIQNCPKTHDMDAYQLKNYFNLQSGLIKRKIISIQKERFNDVNTHISDYGETNSNEFFAETFANLVTSKTPTTLAKSLEIYLKENLYVDE